MFLMGTVGPRRPSGIYLESTRDERYGVLPGEDRFVKDVMSREVVTVDALTSVRDAADTMRHRQVPALVVYRDKQLAGVLTERDVAVNGTTKAEHPGSMTVQEVMTSREPISCREDAILADATRVMADHHLPSVPVVNAEGDVVGLLSLLDAAGALMPNVAAAWLAKTRNPISRPRPPMDDSRPSPERA